MAANGAPDPALMYSYEDSLLNTPLTPVAAPGGLEAGPHEEGSEGSVGSRQPDWPAVLRWLLQRRPHPVKWLGDGLLFLASVDRDHVGSRSERYRYHTIAVLMLLTGVQACYSATLFMSMSLDKPLHSEILFGVVFAAAVIFIDRSIISYAPKARLNRRTGAPVPPRKFSGVLVVRLVIAIAAALLMSEMILLQVFAGDIGEQVQANQLIAKQGATTQIEATYQNQINNLQGQINKAQATADQEQQKADAAYQAMNCQEFGCKSQGITAGEKQGFFAAKQNYEADESALASDLANVKTVHSEVDPQIKLVTSEEQTAIKNAQVPISHADKILSQEEAFLQLTIKNGAVLATRLLLSLLILGIDLGPILTKLTGRTSLHDVHVYYSDISALERERHDVTTSLYRHQEQGKLNRQVHDLEMGDALFEAQRDSAVARAKVTARGRFSRYKIDLKAHRKMLWAHHRYLIGRPPQSSWPQGARARNSGPRPWQRDVRPGGPYDDDDDDVPAVFGYHPPASSSKGDAGQADAGFMGAPVASLDPRAPSVGPVDPAIDPFAPPPGSPGPPGPPGDPGQPGWMPDSLGGPLGSYWTRTSGQIDEQAGIYSAQQAAAQENADGAAVLGGRWVLHGPLPGADPGGGGTVLRAKDRLSADQSAWYVVKTVPSGEVEKSAKRSIRQLGLRHEERAAAVISEYVGEVLDHGEDSGFFYLVYPLYVPGSLSAHCERFRGRLILGWCATVIHEVLTGLIAAADVGLVHLDIKPGNIVMDGNRARVIDWGLSRKFDAARPSTWVARGTPFFACPEQLSGSAPGWDTPRADLYGVGALFYWLLTSEPPLWYEAGPDGDDPFGYRNLIVAGVRPNRVDELVPGVPRELGLLIDRWLSFDPADRVPRGTPVHDSIRVARAELDALRPALPNMTVGRVTGRGRGRRT